MTLQEWKEIGQLSPSVVDRSSVARRQNRRREQDSGISRTARIIVSALILAEMFGGDGLASVEMNSDGGHVQKESLFYRRESKAAEHLVTVESLRVHYIESGTGRPVVMIHGNAGTVEDFEFGAVQLISREYRVFAIDRPGHGTSDRPAGKTATVEYQTELLHRTLSALGIVQPVLVGHSWGAALALAYALKYPQEVSAIVLLAPAAYPDDGGNSLLHATIRTPVIRDLGLLLGTWIMSLRMLKRVLARAFFPQSVPVDYFKLASSSWLGQKQLKAYLEDEWALNDSLKKMSKRYSDLNIPVVIVTGDQDKIVSRTENAYRLQAAIPQSRLIELKETGHEIPQTHPESIYAALTLISQQSVRKLN